MEWKRKRNQVKLTVSTYKTTVNDLDIQIDAQQGLNGLLCEWAVYKFGFSPIASGVCYGLEEAKALAEAAAEG